MLALLGCDVGVVGDPGTGGGPDSGGNIAACVNRAGAVNPAHQHAAGGTHAGEGCVTSGCHLAAALGAGAPPYQAAGTVYKADGTTPNGGAVVRIVSGSTPLTAFTDDAGNFKFEQATLTYPAKTDTSACPDMTPMVGQITTGPGQGGNCNGAGCHTAGAQGPIKFQ